MYGSSAAAALLLFLLKLKGISCRSRHQTLQLFLVVQWTAVFSSLSSNLRFATFSAGEKKKTVSHFFLQTLSRGWPKEEKLMFSSTLFRLLRETSMGLGLLPLSRVVELVGYSTNYGSMLKLKRGGAGAGYLKWRELPLCMRSAQCHWRGRLTVSAIKWHSKELLG